MADQLAARAVDRIPRSWRVGRGVRRGVGRARGERGTPPGRQAASGHQGDLGRRALVRPALRARRAEFGDRLGRGQRARLLAPAIIDDQVQRDLQRPRGGRDGRGRRLVNGRPAGARSIDEILASARERLDRVTPDQAYAELCEGAALIDIRPAAQRAEHGEIPGSVIIERNHLEWRLDPDGDARLPWVAGYDLRPIVICNEGYTSSLAAAALQDLGLARATDVIGGYQAWRADGLPTARPGERAVVPAPRAGPAAGLRPAGPGEPAVARAPGAGPASPPIEPFRDVSRCSA